MSNTLVKGNNTIGTQGISTQGVSTQGILVLLRPLCLANLIGARISKKCQ